MDINAIRTILENMGSRPLDNPQGDIAPVAAPDVSGGVAGIGGDPHENRIADTSGELPAAQPAPIVDVPGGIGQDPHRPLDQSIGEETKDGEGDEDEGTMAEEFAKHLSEHVKFSIEFKDAGILEALQLDEDLAAQAMSQIQTTVQEAAEAHAAKLTEAASAIMEQLVTAKIKAIEESVDGYFDSVVTEWMQENKLAVMEGVRTEIAESFMEEMKSVFERHYVEMPKAKKDLYEEAISKGEEVFNKLTESESARQDLEEQLKTAQRKLLIEATAVGMVATKAVKFRELAEGLEAGEGFEDRLKALAEEIKDVQPATPASTTVSEAVVEDLSDTQQVIQEEKRERKIDSMMESYMRFLR